MKIKRDSHSFASQCETILSLEASQDNKLFLSSSRVLVKTNAIKIFTALSIAAFKRCSIIQSTYEFLNLKGLYEIDFDLTQFVSRTISFSRNLPLILAKHTA